MLVESKTTLILEFKKLEKLSQKKVKYRMKE